MFVFVSAEAALLLHHGILKDAHGYLHGNKSITAVHCKRLCTKSLFFKSVNGFKFK